MHHSVKTFSLRSDSLKLTRGAGLGYANVAGIIRVYLEITTFSSPHRFEVELAWRLGVGLVPAVLFTLRLDDVGGEARGAGLVEVLGKDWAPLGVM